MRVCAAPYAAIQGPAWGCTTVRTTAAGRSSIELLYI